MAIKMTLKRLKAMHESSDSEKTVWRQDKGIQDPFIREIAKISKAVAKAKRMHAKLGKKFGGKTK